MGFWGTSIFLLVACLCGSACSVYKGDSLKLERQREQPNTAPFAPPAFRDFELPNLAPSTITITPRPGNGSVPNTKPPEDPKASEPPAAGRQAPSKDEAPEAEQDRRDEMEIADDDAGVTPEPSEPPAPVDAGTLDADAGTQQRIATGTPRERDEPNEPDAGRPRNVAKASAACRGELGYEADGRCYFVVETPVSWNVGRDRCYEHDAHLASVTSEHESDLIASFDLDDDVWIGFSRFGAANFSWLTNESGSFSNWKKGAPRAMQESGALILASTGLWTNRDVPELHPALCETERKTTRRRD
jgi:hypothetical protein